MSNLKLKEKKICPWCHKQIDHVKEGNDDDTSITFGDLPIVRYCPKCKGPIDIRDSEIDYSKNGLKA